MHPSLGGLRYAVRVLLMNRGVTIVALLTLVFGIVLNTAAFSVCNALWFGPLPFPASDRLVILLEQHRTQGVQRLPSYESFRLWRGEAGAFEAFAALEEREFNLGGGGLEAERVSGVRASEDLLSVLGFRTLAGRPLAPSDYAADASRVALITEPLWISSFGRRADAVGSRVTVDGETTTIVGILPREFRFLFGGYRVVLPLREMRDPKRAPGGLQVVARLKPGGSAAASGARLAPLAREMQRTRPDTHGEWDVAVSPLRDRWLKDARSMYPILLVAAGFVLLIVCANISNVLLARAGAREKEMALRVAMGAGRSDLLWQMLTEGILLASAGGMLATFLSYVLGRLLVASYPEMAALRMDWRVLLYTLAISVLAGLAAGIGPAVSASRPNLEQALRREGGAVARGGRHRLRQALVLCEMSLAVVMLCGTGLLVKTVLTLVRADTGFRAANLISARVSLPEFKYVREQDRSRFFNNALDALTALPAVRSVGAASSAPLLSAPSRVKLEIEGVAAGPAGATRAITLTTIAPGYFATLGVPIHAGRDLSAGDTHTSAAVVNMAMAKAMFRSAGDALGRRIRIAGGEWTTIVGVSGDVPQDLLRPTFPEIFRPPSGDCPASMVLVARTSLEPELLAASVRKAIRGLDADVPVSDLRSVESIKGEYFPKVMAIGLGGFAMIALALAAIGLYGVVSYLTSQRTRELGVRMALGAGRLRVVGLVVNQGLGIALAGAAIGVAGSIAVGRFLARFLAGVSPLDWSVFGSVTLLLVAVAGAASVIPAWSASRISPMAALRHD